MNFESITAGAVSPRWVKSTYSGDEGGHCVEVASSTPAIAAVRDSKRPHAPMLRFDSAAWADLVAGLTISL